MSNKKPISPLSLAAGAVFAASLGASPAAQADINPFAMTALSSGYMLAEKGAEGQCGASKRVKEAECGANKAAKKLSESKCGANKAEKPKAKQVLEAKCGEAKCGNNK